MGENMKLSFCTTCMNRVEHLKKTLPHNIELLNKLQKNKSNFLKQFRNSLNPAETDADVISEGAKEVFRKLESDIQNLYGTLNSSLKNYMPKVVTNPLETESNSNEYFDKDFCLSFP